MVKTKIAKKTEKKTTKETKVKSTKVGLTIPVYDLTGKEKAQLELPKEIFSQELNPKLLAQYVRVYMANRRQGTASAKTRSEITGSTKKIYRQKGTGRARHGSKKAPIFVGGGVVGGPRPRDYSLKLNRKQIKKALFNALSLKLKEKELFALGDDFTKMVISTKSISDFLRVIGVKNENILFVLPKMEKNNLVLSSRNIENITMIDTHSLNSYEILRNKKVFFLNPALKILSEQLLNSA